MNILQSSLWLQITAAPWAWFSWWALPVKRSSFFTLPLSAAHGYCLTDGVLSNIVRSVPGNIRHLEVIYLWTGRKEKKLNWNRTCESVVSQQRYLQWHMGKRCYLQHRGAHCSSYGNTTIIFKFGLRTRLYCAIAAIPFMRVTYSSH